MPEYVPVMAIELVIFSLVSTGLILIISNNVFTPVIFALSLLSIFILTVVFCAALAVSLQSVVIPDIMPGILRRALENKLRVGPLNFSVRGYDLSECCRAAFHWFLSWVAMYILHVCVIWINAEDSDSATYWRGLFSPDLSADSDTELSIGVLQFNAVVGISVMVIILVIALMVDHYLVTNLYEFYQANSYTSTPQRSIVYFCVVISQLLQYTLYLRPLELLSENRRVELLYVFIPWGVDVLLNGIVASVLTKRILNQEVYTRSWSDSLVFIISKNGGPVTLLVITILQSPIAAIPWFTFVNDIFWVTNIILTSLLVLTRVYETRKSMRMTTQKTFIERKPSTNSKMSRYNTIGVAQPRFNFRRRPDTTSVRNKRD